MTDQKFTDKRRCEHCGNRAPMEVVYRHNGVTTKGEPWDGYQWQEGYVHDLVRCPACEEFIFMRRFFHDEVDDFTSDEILYPASNRGNLELPEPIKRAYDAAKRVQNIDPNAFGVLLGRLLELICVDRKATGETLNEQLADLAKRGEIPATLIEVARGLRQLRNVGAHASLGELTENDFPILDNLARAILEYVYVAPKLVDIAKARFDECKEAKAWKEGKAEAKKKSEA